MDSYHITTQTSRDGSTIEKKTQATSNVTSSDSSTAIKPCCVCKEEKTQRDNCMLFSTSQDPSQECVETINKYKRCMATYGFNI